MSTVVTGEAWEVSYGIEDTPGTAVAASKFLGLFDKATLPDPEIEMNPFYGAGGHMNRGYFRMQRGKWQLQGSFPDMILLSAHPLYLCMGKSSAISGGYNFDESCDLPSMTVTGTYIDCAGDVLLIRRYVGGKVGRVTLNCEEGEPAKLSLDDVTFLDIQHNLSGYPKYNAGVARETISYPTVQPFYFHGGTLTINGTVFARVRGFTFECNNNVEGRYYWASGNEFVPSSIIQGRREYSLTVKVDIDDNKLFQEIIQAGEYSDEFKGFPIIFKMERDTDDYVEIQIPYDTVSASNHGCFIKKGKLDIVPDPLVTQELEIIARKPRIVVKTNEVY
jgi:hypothetical protein